MYEVVLHLCASKSPLSPKSSPHAQWIAQYQERLQKAPWNTSITHHRTKEAQESAYEELKEKPGHTCFLLDERGSDLTSIDFAGKLQALLEAPSEKRLALFVGPSEGFCPYFLQRVREDEVPGSKSSSKSGFARSSAASAGGNGSQRSLHYKHTKILRLSSLTLGHQFVLVLLFEQLYRASTILNDHPYHK